MRVFVTGASGWIGSATVDDLLEAGHQVVGLARSDASATALATKGATVFRGDLDDLEGLRRGATEADAVVHLANKHDWNDHAATALAERTAVQTLADALVDTDKPFVVASGLALLADGRACVETDRSPAVGLESPRGGSENLALDYVDRGVRTIIARFSPTVHGVGDHGFIAFIARAARANGLSGYVGDGSAAWAAVHVTDAARMIRLSLDKAPAGAILHAVAEEGVPTREIAEAIGANLDLPVGSITAEQSVERIGEFVGRFYGVDLRASSKLTRDLLDWTPTGPTLVEDIKAGGYPA
ncbi:MAG TPA: SDR family oxidoreductase [Pseudonocardiaceae bacterium]|jgi:nucleoside-diphosphate-sugar epimerase